jgi:hypothetical protein
MYIIESYKQTVKTYKRLQDLEFMVGDEGYEFVIYLSKPNIISPGWTEKQYIKNRKVPLIVIPKEDALNLTQEKYDYYIEQMKLEIKNWKMKDKLKTIEEDFV